MDSNSKRKLIDLLAAVGVVASLIFVGLEVRQNTLISRSAAVESITEQVNDGQIEMASNDDWIRITENRYRQVQFGFIDPSELEVGGGKANISRAAAK